MKSVIARLVVFLCLSAVLHAKTTDEKGLLISSAAKAQIGITTNYDPSYVELAYPFGDIPITTGVCSDVVVRALRQVNIDLQKDLNEDMTQNFSAYPQNWGLKKPDKNIDHRRVFNLMCFFERKHMSVDENLTASQSYHAGDIVAWQLSKGRTHIGIVSNKKAGTTPLIIHNIGSGTKEENVLFSYKIIGHYRIK